MPLNKNSLKNDINRLLNPNSVNFLGYGNNGQEVAEKWGDVLRKYVMNNLFPLSTTYDNAYNSFVNIFKEVNYQNYNGFDLLEQSIRAFSLSLGPGMFGYQPTPILNPSEIFLTTIPIGISSINYDTYTTSISNDIHNWMLSNKSNSLSGNPINWL